MHLRPQLYCCAKCSQLHRRGADRDRRGSGGLWSRSSSRLRAWRDGGSWRRGRCRRTLCRGRLFLFCRSCGLRFSRGSDCRKGGSRWRGWCRRLRRGRPFLLCRAGALGLLWGSRCRRPRGRGRRVRCRSPAVATGAQGQDDDQRRQNCEPAGWKPVSLYSHDVL